MLNYFIRTNVKCKKHLITKSITFKVKCAQQCYCERLLKHVQHRPTFVVKMSEGRGQC